MWPLKEKKSKTNILDENYSTVNIVVEKMKATWVWSGHNIIVDGRTDIKQHQLIDIMVTYVETLYFLGAIDSLRHGKDVEF